MEGTTYSSLQLSSWKAYKDLVDDLSENWAFRGQANAGWELQNAIERTDFIKLYNGIEAEFLAEFQRGARNYLQKDETPNHLIEWLALMQHHGAPTRLLDFSKSPFIAAFFAFEQAQLVTEETISIWAINIRFLKEKATELLASHFRKDMEESSNLVNEKLFEKIFHLNKYSLVFPVEPFRMNRRYSLQQSIFVSTGNSYEPFMQQLRFLKDHIHKSVIKIELPAQLHKEVLRALQRMNLHRASLFPDLDGYAGSLRLRYNSMQSPEEADACRQQKEQDATFQFYP